MTDTARDQAIAQCQSIVAMVAAVDVDYDRLEELRDLRDTPRFVAGWNMPGYMPDSEPASFDNVEDAREYVADEMANWLESQCSEGVECEDLRHALQIVREGSGEFGITVGGYHYWVTQDGNMLEPDDAEELAELEAIVGDCDSQDDALERIQEYPLSIEYRSGWVTPGEELTPEEFRIVLCTGGPHVEIVGECDLSRVRVLYRDWGDSGELFDFDRDAVISYCSLVGIGE